MGGLRLERGPLAGGTGDEPIQRDLDAAAAQTGTEAFSSVAEPFAARTL
jgi:hypothetical protein